MSTIPVSDLLVSNASATWEHQGMPLFIVPGMVVRSDNPVIKGHEQHFSPLILMLAFDQDLPPSKTSVVVCGSGGDDHGFVHGRDQFPVWTWRTKPVVLV